MHVRMPCAESPITRPNEERPPALTLMALLKTVISEHDPQTEFDLSLRAQSIDTRAISDPE